MALAIGTNSGFVSSAPSSDPAGTGFYCPDAIVATKDTSPAGSYKVTAMGVWCFIDNVSRTYKLALYSHDSANGRPNALVGSIGGSSSSTSGWKTVTGLSQALDSSTAYWLCGAYSGTYADVTIANDRATSGASGYGFNNYDGPNLPDPSWNSGAFDTYDADGMVAIYALYEAANTNYQRAVAGALGWAGGSAKRKFTGKRKEVGSI